jgi:hypothetical protein
MKVGLRLGKCVLDIVKGDVLITDVLVIVANSRINPKNDEQWAKVWNVYKNESKIWDVGIHEEVFKYTLRRLFELGKLHQPKTYGGRTHSFKEPWVDIVPTLRDTAIPENFNIPGKPTPKPLPKLGSTRPATLAAEQPTTMAPTVIASFPEIATIMPDIIL